LLIVSSAIALPHIIDRSDGSVPAVSSKTSEKTGSGQDPSLSFPQTEKTDQTGKTNDNTEDQTVDKKRLIVLTDISSIKTGVGEPDDTQSLIRLLLYADLFDIEGLLSTYTSHGKRCFPEHINAVLRAYREDLPCLMRYGDYPSAESLFELVKKGSDVIGVDAIGEGRDTDASEQIIKAVDRDDDRPLYMVIWGGSLDLAQALFKVRSTRTQDEVEKFIGKLRVNAITDQYDDCGKWIRDNFPNLFYITSYSSFRGMYRGGDEYLVSSEWVKENISGHGALGRLYPVYNGGDPSGKVLGIKEGDTPSFLSLISGIADPEDPTADNWGGTFSGVGNHFFDHPDFDTAIETVYRWRADYQADFAARMDRCIP